MNINLKKIFWAVALVIGALVYIHDHYTFQDVLAYSKKHPDPEVSPKLDYYVGMAYYLRDRYPESEGAFQQLLTDYPTGYYAPQALIQLGSIYSDQNRWQLARDMYQQYLDNFPEGKGVEQVRKKYEIIKFR